MDLNYESGLMCLFFGNTFQRATWKDVDKETKEANKMLLMSGNRHPLLAAMREQI
jgi:hypothetical protein